MRMWWKLVQRIIGHKCSFLPSHRETVRDAKGPREVVVYACEICGRPVSGELDADTPEYEMVRWQRW